ncbi:hypothetical protein [Parabacteroides sp.]
MKTKLLMIFVALLGYIGTALADDWITNGSPTDWSGSYDSQDEFTISSAQDLAGIAKLTNADANSKDFDGKTIKLGANINLSNYDWIPIKQFKGTFDGQGYSITGLKVNETNESKSAGFFGEIEGSSKDNPILISNLHIEGEVSGKKECGLLAGSCTYANVVNCSVEGKVSFTRDRGSDAGTSLFIGYFPAGTIQNCLAIGTIELTNASYCGGLVGCNAKGEGVTIENCCVILKNDPLDTEWARTESADNLKRLFGNFVGAMENDSDNPLVLNNNYCQASNRRETTSSATSSEGISTYEDIDYPNAEAWYSNQSADTWCAWTTEENNGKSQPALDFGNYNIPTSWLTKAMKAKVATNGDDIEVDNESTPTQFTIKTPKGLAWLAYKGSTNKAIAPAKSNFENCTITLANDINMSSDKPDNDSWIPISILNGTFDGNGKAIKNLKQTVNEYGNGFILIGDKNSDIKNLTLENVSITGTVDKGKEWAIGIICLKGGNISNCHTEGGNVDITVTSNTSIMIGGIQGASENGKLSDCHNGTSIKVIHQGTAEQIMIGGISGYKYEQTINCYNTGNITVEGSSQYTQIGGILGFGNALENSYNTGDITYTGKGDGLCTIGGIAGSVIGRVANCYSTGKVTATTSTSSTTTFEDIQNFLVAGGICGAVQSFEGDHFGFLYNCFATGDVSSDMLAGGIAGIGIGDEDKPVSINNCIALNRSIYSKINMAARITPVITELGEEFNANPAIIKDCYAFAGMKLNDAIPETEKEVNKSNGADWDNNLAGSPVTAWDAGAWDIPSTKAATPDLMPKLNRIKPDTYKYNEDLSSNKEYITGNPQTRLVPNQPDVVIPTVTTPDPDPDPDPEPTPTPEPDPTPVVFYTVKLPAVEGAITDPVAGNYEVESWDSFRFYLTLDKEYDQSTPVVTTNRGETIEPRSSDGAYIIKYVRTDVEIFINSIVKNPDPVGNETIEATSPKVWAENKRLHIQAVAQGMGYVYSADGRLLLTCNLNIGEEYSAGLPGGIYFVVIGNERFRVML